MKPKPVKSFEIVNLTSTAAYIKLERPNVSCSIKLQCRITWTMTEGSQSKSNTSLIDLSKKPCMQKVEKYPITIQFLRTYVIVMGIADVKLAYGPVHHGYIKNHI